MTGNRFGYDPRQLNLMAVRLIQEFVEHHPDLDDPTKVVMLNVAQEDDETIDIPIQDMSAKVLVAFVVALVSANNLSLTAQLRDLGLEPPAPYTDIQPMSQTEL